ncbi:hypothetical protein [Pedobacter sp. Hv1]|uniref:hypothetical protein n=1 Tax=Pedobacter sp. Hv1 TaxID=1740090 RepID=UPI0006D8A6E9|nr:hypothetical protein [Pedobacter sp. Hv1]KQC01196.1 hypothetical protein AQF98_11075 [Pedobacter sp. Hv1]
MIGIFHSFPSISDLKRNFLFFEELQTSEAFLKGNLEQLIRFTGSRGEDNEYLNRFLCDIEYLFELGVISANEDIETRILPEYGGFNNNIINLYLGMGKRKVDKNLMEFYKNVKSIKDVFGIEIIGRSNFNQILAPSWDGSEKFPLEDFLSNRTSLHSILDFINHFSSLYSRYATVFLNKKFDDKVYSPLVTTDSAPRKINLSYLHDRWDDDSRNQRLIKVIIDKLPVPDDSTSWEQLIDFKNDRHSFGASLALRNWINEMARSDLKLYEITDKLEDLLYRYQENLAIHKIRYRSGLFESIVLPTAEFLEDMASFKPSKATKAVIELHKRQYYALEDELKLPGREIAYIQKANDFFCRS